MIPRTGIEYIITRRGSNHVAVAWDRGHTAAGENCVEAGAVLLQKRIILGRPDCDESILMFSGQNCLIVRHTRAA